MEDLFMLWIQMYGLQGEHGLVVISAPLCCFVPVLHLSFSALQLPAFQGCFLLLPLSYLSTCKSGLGILPALGSIGMWGSYRFEGGLCSPCAVLGLNLLLTSVVAVPCVRFCSCMAHFGKCPSIQGSDSKGQLGAMHFCHWGNHTLIWKQATFSEWCLFYMILNLYFFRPFAVLWRVLDYWCYKIYLGYLEKKS